VQIRHRRALPQDIDRGREILEPERVLFSPRTWQLLPELLEDLTPGSSVPVVLTYLGRSSNAVSISVQ
jgi:hypothetical protein